MVTSSFLKAWITAKSVSILSSTSVYATYKLGLSAKTAFGD